MKMSGAKAIVECLKKEGVKDAFGYPGGAIMPFYDELQKDGEVRHILSRHEQGAAHAAEGYARASGKVGVCISTSGPGGTNLLTGIADAYSDSVPIVALSGQVATPLIGGDAFQEADMFGLTMPITKHNFKVMNARELPEMMRSAFIISQTGRPGPVHIDIPKDVQTNEIDFEYPKNLKLRGFQPKVEGHPVQIARAMEMMLNAERPVILAGGGVISSNASQELAKLAETLMCPVTTTLMGKGAISDYHPLALGMPGMHGRKVANYALANCDVLLAIGTRFSDRVTGNVNEFVKGAKVIHVDVDSAEIGKNVGVELPIVGNAKNVLTEMLMRLNEEKKKAKENEWRKRMKELREACECEAGGSETPIKCARVMKELNKIASENTIFTTEVGQNQMWAAHFLKIRGARQFISSGGLGTMGFGLPAAIGAKCAKPESPVMDIAGDGSLLMVCQEFTTSVEFDLPVSVCLMNNGWLGMVKQWQKLFFDKRYSATNLGKMPDFVKLVQAFGGDGVKVERASELSEALGKSFKSRVPYVVDIHVDPEDDILPMVPPGGRIDKMIGSERCGRVDALISKF
ncbi:MAG: biosynthetic-type acetolactate synthase large subunit [Candidatus Micrarchaeota archaeon]